MPSQKIETDHQDVVHDLAMDNYGKCVTIASSDLSIKITGASNSTSQYLATLTGHQGPGNQNEWTQVHVFSDHKSSVNSIAWAPHELGLCLTCGSSDGNILIFVAKLDGGWDTLRIDKARSLGVTFVSWALSTALDALVGFGLLNPVQKLCFGGCDNTVKVWKLYEGNWKVDCFPALHMHIDWVHDVAWAPNFGLPKSTIASASKYWESKVLNEFKTTIWRVSRSLAINLLAVVDGNNNVTLLREAVDGEWQQVTTIEP
ncbi:hypothetical protein I3843_01G224300 [Carya illinoinensis]|nr:hypothetical protein I3843_01G224300 [Carya illinoinensis]